jgi:predicted lipoprotein with Yx(FWY)xxD motif
MHMRTRWIVAALVAVMALAGCGADEGAGADDAAPESEVAAAPSEPAAETAEEPSEPADDSAAAGTAAVEVASSDLGDILVDTEGMTLYVFDSDTDENSTCYDDCEANWPPLTGEATAGDGVDESLLGTSEREDGTTQVTYAGKPVYYFAGDQAAGDTNGQAVGDVWWVVGPDGEAITDAAGGDDAAADTETSGY